MAEHDDFELEHGEEDRAPETDAIEFPIVVTLLKPLRSTGAKTGLETLVTEVRIPEEPTAGQLRQLMRVPGDEKLFKALELFTDLPPHLINSLGVRDLRAIDKELRLFF